MKTTQTNELHRCVHSILEMLAHLESALECVESSERSGHDLDEIRLFCTNLERHLRNDLLKDSSAGQKHRWKEHYGTLQRAIEQAELLAGAVDQHHGDSRISNALVLLGDALIFSTAAVLRWCHSSGGGHAFDTVENLEDRMTRALGSLERAG